MVNNLRQSVLEIINGHFIVLVNLITHLVSKILCLCFILGSLLVSSIGIHTSKFIILGISIGIRLSKWIIWFGCICIWSLALCKSVLVHCTSTNRFQSFYSLLICLLIFRIVLAFFYHFIVHCFKSAHLLVKGHIKLFTIVRIGWEESVFLGDNNLIHKFLSFFYRII